MKLNNELLPHQRAAVDKLIKLKVGALFMEQGTGKTITCLEIARQRLERGKIERVIWLCPCSAKKNIKREILKQAPVELCSVVTICGIETLSTGVRALSYLYSLAEKERCFLVVDESLLIKNPKAKRTQNIQNLADKCTYKMILNGTPVSRNEADLFSQFYLLDWRILGYKSYWSFAANHLEYNDRGQLRKVLGVESLTEKINPFVFQVTKSDCLQLPPKHYETHYFELTSAQWSEYGRVEEILLTGLDEYKPSTLYRFFSGLQAVISGKKLVFDEREKHFEAKEFFRSPKDNPRVQELLRVLTDEKTIIFCHYESEISQLCEILPDAVRFDGQVSAKKRDEALLAFSKDKKYLIANKGCAGYSLNLQFCHKIIYFSNDWDLGTQKQSEDRVHRIGQTEDVEIEYICAEGSIDEQILNCLYRKEGLLESLKDTIGEKQSLKERLSAMAHGGLIQEVSDNAQNIP